MKDMNKKHGSVYSPMQLRIWGELRAGGFHNSLDDPPTFNTMFQRAGGESSKKQSPVVRRGTQSGLFSHFLFRLNFILLPPINLILLSKDCSCSELSNGILSYYSHIIMDIQHDHTT